MLSSFIEYKLNTIFISLHRELCFLGSFRRITFEIHRLQKQNRRLRLSKVKHSKFNESGQLLIFYVCSAMAGFYIVSEEGYASNVAMLWTDYPHLHLSYLMKYYFIGQVDDCKSLTRITFVRDFIRVYVEVSFVRVFITVFVRFPFVKPL